MFNNIDCGEWTDMFNNDLVDENFNKKFDERFKKKI
jgi:hypothetical protein